MRKDAIMALVAMTAVVVQSCEQGGYVPPGDATHDMPVDDWSGVDTWEMDRDLDGFTPADGDCDDEQFGVNPNAYDDPDNLVDDDCDTIRDNPPTDCDCGEAPTLQPPGSPLSTLVDSIRVSRLSNLLVLPASTAFLRRRLRPKRPPWFVATWAVSARPSRQALTPPARSASSWPATLSPDRPTVLSKPTSNSKLKRICPTHCKAASGGINRRWKP